MFFLKKVSKINLSEISEIFSDKSTWYSLYKGNKNARFKFVISDKFTPSYKYSTSRDETIDLHFSDKTKNIVFASIFDPYCS